MKDRKNSHARKDERKKQQPEVEEKTWIWFNAHQSDSPKISNLSFRVFFLRLLPFICSSVIKSGMNERTPLFVSDLHLIGLIIQKGKQKTRKKHAHTKSTVFPTFIRRIIIHLAMHKQSAREKMRSEREKEGKKRNTKPRCHSKAQAFNYHFLSLFHAIYYVLLLFAAPQIIAIPQWQSK